MAYICKYNVHAFIDFVFDDFGAALQLKSAWFIAIADSGKDVFMYAGP